MSVCTYTPNSTTIREFYFRLDALTCKLYSCTLPLLLKPSSFPQIEYIVLAPPSPANRLTSNLTPWAVMHIPIIRPYI